MNLSGCTGYLAREEYYELLRSELNGVCAEFGRLIFAEGPPQSAYWAQNIWYDPVLIPIKSIGDAAEKLKALQRNWALYPYECHRRAHLITERLPYISKKALKFPNVLPEAPMGSWMLLDADTLLVSQRCSSPFAHGEPVFEECRIGPPSRAYLKLWEALTLLQRVPQVGDQCLEVGASPGGWTWVLAKLGADVTAIDRAEIDPELAKLPNVHFRAGNAFAIGPDDVDHLDWLFSDLICYPDKLYEWISLWIESGKCKRFVCTLKFQGKEHYGAIKDFEAIPGSRVLHLNQNKHELTWMLDLEE